MDELNLKVFIGLRQKIVDKYRKMAKKSKTSNYDVEIKQHQEVIDALEKQIAKDAELDVIVNFYRCPNCRAKVNKTQKHCEYCGQKLSFKKVD